MKITKTRYLISIVSISLLFVSCGSKLTISGVDYSQPIESVIKPNDRGQVIDPRTGINFNINPLQFNETNDTTRVVAPEVRFIRNHEGYYFVIAPGFKHVYVMKPDENTLVLHNAILITSDGVQEPAFNQRKPYIQLMDGESKSYNLTKDSIQ